MDDVRDRLTRFLTALPVAHRIGIGAAIIGLVMASVVFFSWVMAPEMTVLASGLDDTGLSSVIDELEAANIPYELGGAGTTVLVARDQLYTTRARLASSGVASGDTVEGWEILDDQSIAINESQQQVNYQRALEGELSRTLMTMEGIDQATVHLVLPEDRLFTEQQEAHTASVLLDTGRTLNADEIEAVVFLVSSAVGGLETGDVTVADTDGTVLHAPGESGGMTTGASRQLRETREFEQALAGDIQRLLTTATGSAASVVVRASLDFNATSTETRSFDPNSQVATSEKLVDERYDGTGATDAGAVGVDGGPVGEAGAGSETNYERNEVLREFGVNETVSMTTQAPGKVDGISVAIVMDDGSLTGVTMPAEEEVSGLVAAAVGLDAARGDVVAVTRVAFPAPVEADDGVAAMDVPALATQVGSVLVLLVVALALFLMSRRRDPEVAEEGEITTQLVAQADGSVVAMPVVHQIGADGRERVLVADAVEIDPTVGGARRGPPVAPTPPDDTARREVEALVDKQPAEIANLLRGWLADVS